jgi:hypothetical protein
MENLSEFCTCNKATICQLHPANHEKGCTPCIEKNLRTKEIPGCFFRLIEGYEEADTGNYHLEDFAKLVLGSNK